jgi:hypothetical protein
MRFILEFGYLSAATVAGGLISFWRGSPLETPIALWFGLFLMWRSCERAARP